MNSVSVVILAAGRGKRMYSNLPKVLHPLGGRPMLARVLDLAQALTPAQCVVVIGHGAEQVRAAFASQPGPLAFALQTEQLGPGHAVKMALPHLPADGRTLVLYGDVPLTEADTLARLLGLGCAHRVIVALAGAVSGGRWGFLEVPSCPPRMFNI